MSSLTIKNLNKIYNPGKNEVHAVKDFNLEIEDGEFVALLGPSGCGKTSTLRMIVGLESITSGSILFDDVEINHLSPEHRNVAMAFESYALYPNFTIFENLAFPLEVKKNSSSEISKKVGDIAEMLQITNILELKPNQLSGGQQQRVSLGRALIRDPAVFILDEVMSHLDAHLKFQMLFELKKIHQTLKKTMIYVTHDQMEALALSDRVAVMANAVLQQFGDRNDLYHRPKNLFVADFIGEPATNFMKAQYSQNSKMKISGDLQFSLTNEISSEIERKQMSDAVLGLRPQNLSLEPIEGGDYIQGELVINEFLGERSILEIKSGETLFKMLTDPQKNIKKGDSLKIYYKKENVMIFHPETEELIEKAS